MASFFSKKNTTTSSNNQQSKKPVDKELSGLACRFKVSCSAIKECAAHNWISFPVFATGEHFWYINCCPIKKGRKGEVDYLSFYLWYGGEWNDVKITIDFGVLKQGEASSSIKWKTSTQTFPKCGECFGLEKFVRKDDLKRYLKDDFFTILCNITILNSGCTGETNSGVIILSSLIGTSSSHFIEVLPLGNKNIKPKKTMDSEMNEISSSGLFQFKVASSHIIANMGRDFDFPIFMVGENCWHIRCHYGDDKKLSFYIITRSATKDLKVCLEFMLKGEDISSAKWMTTTHTFKKCGESIFIDKFAEGDELKRYLQKDHLRVIFNITTISEILSLDHDVTILGSNGEPKSKSVNGTFNGPYPNFHTNKLKSANGPYLNLHANKPSHDELYPNLHANKPSRDELFPNLHVNKPSQDELYPSFHSNKSSHDESYPSFHANKPSHDELYPSFRSNGQSSNRSSINYTSEPSSNRSSTNIKGPSSNRSYTNFQVNEPSSKEEYPNLRVNEPSPNESYPNLHVDRLSSNELRPNLHVNGPHAQTNLHKNLYNLLKNKVRIDVIFNVNGELFHAHKLVLATQSSVFNAVLPMDRNGTKEIKIDDIQPRVFEAMLHFVYTGMLSDLNESIQGEIEMFRDLLVAADRYALERLKQICEDKLSKSITINTVAMTLALAEKHNYRNLKARCIEFATAPQNFMKVAVTDGYRYLLLSCPTVLKELGEKVNSMSI